MNPEYREQLVYYRHNIKHCPTYRQMADVGLYRTPVRLRTGEMELECKRPCCVIGRTDHPNVWHPN